MRIPLISAWTQPDRPVGRVTFAVLAIAVIFFDQLSKLAAVRWLHPLQVNPYTPLEQQFVPVIPNCFALWYRENTGAAFSMFEQHTGLLSLFSAAISCGFLVWAWRIKPQERGLRIAFGLIVGGALGNLIDRVRLNYVIDFLHVYWREYAWPTFNIADSAVCVGMAFLFIASLRLPKETGASAPTATAQATTPATSTDAVAATAEPSRPTAGRTT